MKNWTSYLEQLVAHIEGGAPLIPREAEVFLEEYKRVVAELAETKAVLADLMEEKGSAEFRVEREQELERLRATCVSLREALGWSNSPEYRFTAVME